MGHEQVERSCVQEWDKEVMRSLVTCGCLLPLLLAPNPMRQGWTLPRISLFLGAANGQWQQATWGAQPVSPVQHDSPPILALQGKINRPDRDPHLTLTHTQKGSGRYLLLPNRSTPIVPCHAMLIIRDFPCLPSCFTFFPLYGSRHPPQ